MNIVLAVSIVLALGCALFIRTVCLYNIKYRTNHFDKATTVALFVMAASAAVFAIEMLFEPFHIII